MEIQLAELGKELLIKTTPVVLILYVMLRNLKERLLILDSRMTEMEKSIVKLQVMNPSVKISHNEKLLAMHREDSRKEFREVRDDLKELRSKIDAAWKNLDTINGVPRRN